MIKTYTYFPGTFLFLNTFFYFNVYVCKPIQTRYYKKQLFYDYDFYLVYHKTMNVIHNASWYLILVASICIQMSLQRKPFICSNVHRQKKKISLYFWKASSLVHWLTLLSLKILLQWALVCAIIWRLFYISSCFG